MMKEKLDYYKQNAFNFDNEEEKYLELKGEYIWKSEKYIEEDLSSALDLLSRF